MESKAKDIKRMGKYVSMLLRHHPEEAGVVLDEHGWTDVEDLIRKVSPRYELTEELLHEMAFGADKQRYEFSEDGKRVRAVHDHSVKVDLGYEELNRRFIASLKAKSYNRIMTNFSLTF